MKVKYLSSSNKLDNKSRLIHSLACFTCYLGLGTVFTIIGSCLLDYQILVNESFQKFTQIVPRRAFGYIFGSLAASFFDETVNKVLFLCLSNFTLSVSLIVTPWCENFFTLSVVTVIGGIAIGFLVIYCDCHVTNIWKGQSTNYLQAMHLFFDIGAIIEPLITRPFLLRSTDHDEHERHQLKAFKNLTEMQTFTRDDLRIKTPHLILGLLHALIALIFGYIFIHINIDEDQVEQPPSTSNDNKKSSPKQWKQNLAITLTALIVFFEFGGQIVVSILNVRLRLSALYDNSFVFTRIKGSLGPAFGVKSNLNMDKQDAALLVTAFWTLAFFYRLVLIPLKLYFDETSLIILNVVIILTGATTMVSGADSNLTLAWISFGLIGMGFSPCFAFAIGLIQKCFDLTSRATSFIFFTGVMGESIHSWIIAINMESSSAFYSNYLALMALINSFVCICLVILMSRFFN